MSMPESFLGTTLATFINMHVFPRLSGAVITADAQFRMLHGNVRMPDVSFILRSRMPNPLPQVGGWCPDLCVEVLSPSNTKKEMTIKRGECFNSGCRLFWIIDRKKRLVEVYRLDGTSQKLTITDSFDGEDVLPGFVLPLADLFGKFDSLSTST